MGLKAQDKGKLVGRVLTEALPNGGTMPLVQSSVLRSEPDALGNVTVLDDQTRRPGGLLRCRRLSRPHARPAA